ncbi:MAG: 50S ribosomal protein L9 [Phycisphaerae bacterium]
MSVKLLLRKDIPKLGLAGDLVEVSLGYARNYLLPHHLALEPTKRNLSQIESDKRVAAEERARRHEHLKRELARLEGKEVTISAAANPEGHLYGSVGPRDIAKALMADGHAVQPDQIRMDEPIKQLDTKMVTVTLADGLSCEVKVWVVREKTAEDLAAEAAAAAASPPAGGDGEATAGANAAG